MDQLDPKKFFENVFEAVQDDQKKKRRKTILWSILVGIIIYIISFPCFLHPFWNFTHFFSGPGVCTHFTLEGLSDSDDFDTFLKGRMMALLGGNGNLPLNTLLNAAGVTLGNGTISNTQTISSPTASYTTYNTATQQLLAGSGISVITNNGGTIINAVLGDNVNLTNEVTGMLPAGSISNTDDVTAGSTKVTLGGTPQGAVLKPFSIDVNEAALNLANLGGVINLTNQVTGVLPVTNGGTGLSTAGPNGTIFTVVAGVPTWAPASTVVVPNDVTVGSTKVTLGGTPTGAALQPFSIDVNEANLSLQNIGGSLLLTQITPGTDGQVLTTVGGVSTWSTPAATTVSNTSTGNDLTTTVNGVTGTAVPIINTNLLSLDANNQLVSTVNGIASTALPIFTAATVDNGLSIGADNMIELGGKLHQGTNIDQAGYDLTMTGGLVGIGTAAPAYTLDVLGDLNQTTVLANGNISSVHSGSNVMGMGLQGESLMNMNTATGDLGFTFIGQASTALEATIGITNFTTGNNAQYHSLIDGGGNYTSSMQTQNGSNYSTITLSPSEIGLSVGTGTDSGYADLTPGWFDVVLVEVRFNEYPNSRDDSTVTTPINFLYTGVDGRVLSAPLSSLGSSLLKYYAESTVSPNVAPLATGANSVAIGDGAQALADNSYVFGKNSTVSGIDSYAIGVSNILNPIQNAYAFGYQNTVRKDYSYAIGNDNVTDGNYSMLVGAGNTTSADNNYVFGYTNSIDGGQNNFSVGYNNVTSGVIGTLLFGQGLTATGDNIVEVGPTNASKITVDSIGRLTLRGPLNVTASDGNAGDMLVSQGPGVAPVWTSTGATNGKFWALNGNAGTNPAVNFIGTTDSQAIFGVKTNNFWRSLNYGPAFIVGSGTALTEVLTALPAINNGISTLNQFYNVYVHSNTTQSAGYRVIRRGGTMTAPTLPPANAILGFVNYQAYTGAIDTNVQTATARIVGTPTATSIPTSYALATTPVGSTTPLDRFFISPAGNVGIGNIIPGNKLEITHGTAGNSGLRFTNLNSASAVSASNGKLLTVNATGDVILATDGSGCVPLAGAATNECLGTSALQLVTTGTANVAVGDNALQALTAGSNNVAVGYQALTANDTGNNNTASGYQALTSNLGGGSNSAFGYRALRLNNTGNFNAAVGMNALGANTGGSTNTAMGYLALAANTTGSNNVGIGWNALATSVTGNSNVGLGMYAGYNVASGSNNTMIGMGAGYVDAAGVITPTTGSNNIIIGTNNNMLPISAGSNQLNIGNLIFGTGISTAGTISTGNVGIGVTAPTAQLHTTGTVRFQAFGAGTLQTDANGNLSVSSDERLKNIEGGFNRGLSALQNIKPIAYHWKTSTGYDTDNLYYGFSAQNIEANIPEAVGEDNRGYLTISDRPILATVVNATKELATNADVTNETITTINTGLEAQSGSLTTLEQTLADNTAAIESLTENVTSLEDRVATLENAGAVTTSSAPADGIFTIAVNFMEDAVFEKVVTFKDMILVEGPAVFSDLVQFNDTVVFNKDAAGHATIASGDSSVEVTFEKPYPNAPVVTVTPNEKVDALYYVTNVTETGFTIEMDPSAAENVKFSWNAVATESAAPAL
jgi:hypothetical protein